ncbi:MAG: chitin deacetylase [Alphaproteobacteria bacterium]|nr:chitin deacetylase [Alphaproteobacteria bacterium]
MIRFFPYHPAIMVTTKKRHRLRPLMAALLSFAAGPAFATDGAAIFAYHSFGATDVPGAALSLAQLESHLAEIARGHYVVLPLPEIVAALGSRRALPDRAIAITVNAADRSVYDEAWPRLRAARLPWTLFVTTSWLDHNDGRGLTWDEVRELAAGGVTIGSQGATHAHLPELTPGAIAADVATAIRRHVAELGAAPELFAYPYGEWSSAVKDALREAGVRAAFGEQSGIAYGGDLLALPRFTMSRAFGNLDRFRTAANALPLRVRDITPREMFRPTNPPQLGFTLAEPITDLDRLSCIAAHENEPAAIEQIGERIEVRFHQPFPPGRGRVNCILPMPDGRWRWLGLQFTMAPS